MAGDDITEKFRLQEYKVPELVELDRDGQVVLGNRIGGGNTADVGVFEGQLQRRDGQIIEVVVKIASSTPRRGDGVLPSDELEREFEELAGGKQIISQTRDYEGARLPVIYGYCDKLLVTKGEETIGAEAIVMELLDPNTRLDEIIKMVRLRGREKLGFLESAQIITKIIEFDRYVLHGRGYTDKDFQPRNYFLIEDGLVRVDLGMRETLSLDSLKTELLDIGRLHLGTLRPNSLPAEELFSKKTDWAVIKEGMNFPHFTRTLVELLFRAKECEDLEVLKEVYCGYSNCLKQLRQVGETLPIVESGGLNAALQSALEKFLAEGTLYDELFVSGLLDLAREKGVTVQLSDASRNEYLTQTKGARIKVPEEISDEDLVMLAIGAGKFTRPENNTYETIVAQISSIGWEEVIGFCKDGFQTYRQNTDPLDIRHRRLIGVLDLLPESTDFGDPQFQQFQNWTKAVVKIGGGDLAKATSLFSLLGYEASYLSQENHIAENEALANAPTAVKSVFYEAKIRRLLGEVDLLKKGGELGTALEKTKELQAYLAQFPDEKYLFALEFNFDEVDPVKAEAQASQLQQRIEKGESIELLREKIAVLEQQLSATTSENVKLQEENNILRTAARYYKQWIILFLELGRGTFFNLENAARKKYGDRQVDKLRTNLKQEL